MLKYIKKRIKYFNQYRKYTKIKFPENIEIGTNSSCNGLCRICPYPSVEKDLPKNDIGDELFKKIIDECSKFNVKQISPLLFNEPFSDSKIIERMKYIRNKNPRTKIYIATNGSLLTEEKSKDLMEVLRKGDCVDFSVHGALTEENYKKEMPGVNFKKTIGNIKQFLEISENRTFEVNILNRTLREENELRKFREFWVKNGLNSNNVKTSELLTRADNIDVGKKKFVKNLFGCAWDRPLKIFHILNNGDVILCCMDWKREVVLGNVNENSIFEIWNSEKYKNIRKIIYGKRKVGNNFICKRCEIAN
jgi:radical SAM protein with 4Fe4S-binding SPASM domain